jgi:DNA-binding MarR family transcriptional regulator
MSTLSSSTNMAGMGDHVATGLETWRELRPDLDLTGMAVFGRVYRLARLADLRRAAILEPHGLQVGDVDVLAPLFRNPGGLRPLELRRAMMIGSGTLTARIDRLEARELIGRHPDPDDRRGRVLRLTAEGARITPSVVAELLQLENDLLAGLSPATRTRLAKDLERLLADVEDPT